MTRPVRQTHVLMASIAARLAPTAVRVQSMTQQMNMAEALKKQPTMQT